MKKTDEAKALYLKELETTSTWRNDPKMIDFCMKEGSVFIQLPSGGLYKINKPHIETRFCYGYSCDYSGDDYNRAQDAARNARQDVENFINENMEGLNKRIKDLEEIKETGSDEHGHKLFILEKAHTGDLEGCQIVDLGRLHNHQALEFNTPELRKHRFRCDTRELLKEDIEALIEAYKQARDLFSKRLQTYLKRFGLSKVYSWTYWADA